MIYLYDVRLPPKCVNLYKRVCPLISLDRIPKLMHIIGTCGIKYKYNCILSQNGKKCSLMCFLLFKHSVKHSQRKRQINKNEYLFMYDFDVDHRMKGMHHFINSSNMYPWRPTHTYVYTYVYVPIC